MKAESDGTIRGVADTALWVAWLRGLESERPDAAFNDSLAKTLAGPRGRAIARSMQQSAMVAWGVVLRTSAIDRLLLEAIAGGVDTVINLGAGMDTRPYRLPLPAALRWIEIDLGDVIDAKNALLVGQQAACQVERVVEDLRVAEKRRALIARLAVTSRAALVIAEGVIPYLANVEVGGLAADLRAIPQVSGWILDFDNAGKRREPRGWAAKLRTAPFLFATDDWFGFFERLGWRRKVTITSADESERIRRPFPMTFPLGLIMRLLPVEVRRRIQSASGAVWLVRT